MYVLLPSETTSTTTSLDGLVGPFEVANHINRRKGRTPDQPPSTLVDPAFPPPPPTSLSPSWPVPPLKASRTCLVFYRTNNIMGIGWRITRGDPREGGPPGTSRDESKYNSSRFSSYAPSPHLIRAAIDWFRAPLGTHGDVHPVYATISQGHPRLSPPQSTLGRRSSSTTAAAHTTRLLHLASTRSSSTTATAPCDATARGVSSCRSTAALLQSDEDGMARRHRHSLPPLCICPTPLPRVHVRWPTPSRVQPRPICFFRILPTASFVRQAFARGDGPPNRRVRGATAPIATPLPPKSEPGSPPKDLLTAAAAALSPPSKPDARFQA
ncbi:hypothetical protein GALMADRAFT_139352 [Galerina marginata CBS 339.88]|uniref:Uncharacterized protein n=1 Tax=Galerina marginata (strain CBS 339.88) TaxID=685588 RepID=A0A067TBV0_GALM3|nr:hypothetical protein GALMADRAFT_139352 [Galerina marginata CBS 339.88]